MRTFLFVALLSAASAIDYTHDNIQYQSLATQNGAYNFGYDTGVFGAHSFHQQWRDDEGEVRGRYGYTDPNGDLRITHYKAGRNGYQILSDKVEPGNPVRAGPRPAPGSGEVLVVPGAAVTKGVSADDAADPVNYRNALVAYPNSGRPLDEYVRGKTRYYVPYRQAGEIGRPISSQKYYPATISKFDRYYRRPIPETTERRTYYKNGIPLSYNPFELFASRRA